MTSPPAPLRLLGWARAAALGFGSVSAVLSLAAPLLLAAAWAAWHATPVEALLAARSVRLWWALLAVALDVAAARAAAGRRWAGAVALLAALLACAQPAAWAAWRFRGECDAGEGEVAPPWRDVRAGGLAHAPELRLESVPATPAAPIRLLVEGRRVEARLGEAVKLGGGLAVTPRAVGVAPFFSVRRANGEVLDSGLVKIGAEERGFMEVGFLPHRFHLRLPPGPPGAVPASIPETIHLRVERGKLKVLDRDVRAGEAVRFEGLTFTYGAEASRWVRLEVERRPRPVLAWAALALLIQAGLAAIVARRRG